MEFQDKVLKCIDCGADFIFTAGEQLFFHDKQFKNEPKRCKACKTKRVSVLGAAPSRARQPLRQSGNPTTCSECGKETTVPFKPNAGTSGLLPGMFPGTKNSGLGLSWRLSPRSQLALPSRDAGLR